jgi:cell division initiation protein
MPIRPIDVRRKEFKNSFRGYDANQVDDFLDAVADEFERAHTENSRMREEVSSLRERLQQFEELEGSIRAALVHAEQAANDLRRSASREAEDLRLSAQREADLTIREAKSRSHQMLAESSSRVERIQESFDALQEAKKNFSNDFRHLLKTYSDVMEKAEVASARDIEASLRGRLDTESIAIAREAAAHEDHESVDATGPLAESEPQGYETQTGGDDGSGDTGGVEQETAYLEQETAYLEQETAYLEEQDQGEPEVAEPEVEEPQPEEQQADEPETVEPEVEPSMAPSNAEDETIVRDRTSDEGERFPEPGADEEVEREEPTLAEESRSQDFFDREQSSTEGEDRGNSRIFRASRFLRRRE